MIRQAFVSFWCRDHNNVPLVLMLARWDGSYGFPGGLVDNGETVEAGIQREIREEIGIEVKKSSFFELYQPQLLTLINDFDFHIFMGCETYNYSVELTYKEMREVAENIPKAPHFLTETYGFALVEISNPCYTEFLKHNFKATAKKELETLVEKYKLLKQ